ncbi:probable protein NAP1 [Humulus lupulus]|uniref:probable protein NAP1 n=1 Tax=Humulus lupulus TaxID=3486 RepID=UPI002B415CD4|nr:probable protein NAP1 [Humulus lupulus]
MTLKSCSPIVGVDVMSFDTEREVLLAWRVVLKENLVLTLFRDEYILLHEEYQLYVLPRILESKRTTKSGRTKQKEADLEYSVA